MEQPAAPAKICGVRGIVFDLDGTLIRGRQALPGAVDAVARLRSNGIRIVFCTQDAENAGAVIASRLTDLGFAAEVDDVVTAGAVIVEHLLTHYREMPVKVIGTPEQMRLLSEQGVRLSEGDEAVRAVLVCQYTGFAATEFKGACRAVWDGADLLAVALDRTFLNDDGLVPGPGALVKAVEHATQRRARVLGKPSFDIAAAALQRLGYPAKEVLVVGDNVDIDVRMGKSASCRTVLVLSGRTSLNDVRRISSRLQPDAVLTDVPALIERLQP
jgi:HAD superfamily hydrolase (TIGR01450 family)